MTRKSQYGWMVVGGILCLCGGVVALKLREGNLAHAQGETPPPARVAADDPPPAPLVVQVGQDKSCHAEPGLMKPLADPTETLPPLGAKDEGPTPPVKLGTPANEPPAVNPTAFQTKDAVPPPGPVGDPPTPPPPPDRLEGGSPMATPQALPSIPPTAAIDPAPPSPPPPPPAQPTISEPKSDHCPEPLPAAVNIEHPPNWVNPPPGSVEPPPPAPRTITRPDSLRVMAPAVVAASQIQIGEPPLASAGPVQLYQVRTGGETLRDIARRTLGAGERWPEVSRLNPNLHAEEALSAGTVVHLPADACLPVDEVEGIKPLPAMRPKTAPAKPRSVMALTGTYPCNIDDKRMIALPRAVRDQFGDAEVVLVSPGPDQCLWLTDQAHQERLAERLEHSPAREIDVRVFKRLYYAQTEKLGVGPDGRIALSDRLAQFAGLNEEVVLVGIDDHFEVWDAARWKQYTQSKSSGASGSE